MWSINEFTFFKIHTTKRQDKNLGKNQMSLLFNGKRKYIYFEDTRTKQKYYFELGIGVNPLTITM